MHKPTILVTGGAGFIGSYVNKMLHREGYQTVVLDNLSRGHRACAKYGIFIEGDLANTSLLNNIFQTYSISAVMHFAAFIDVGESVIDPLKYYFNNVMSTLNLLMTMVDHQVKKFIFSSTAAIYGSPLQPLINESHPCLPINPYGRTKWMVEQMLTDFDKAYGIRFFSLRYFNAAGGDPTGEIKNYQVNASNLIPRILLSLKQRGVITIYGDDYPTPDGTCIRDYVHIEDLGMAHLLALKRVLDGYPSNYYNLGNGKGFSVREVIQQVENVLDVKVQIINGSPRPGDPGVLLADPSKASRELHWHPRHSIEQMIKHAWDVSNI